MLIIDDYAKNMTSDQAMKSNKGHIAIIDDDPEMQSLLSDYFSDSGFKVSTYSLASAALAQLNRESPLESNGSSEDIDLIISDIKMPQMDGLEFVEKLKHTRPEIPVILITAFGSIGSAIESIRRGAYDYIVKPFKLAEVSVSVDRAMEYRRLRRDNTALRKEVKKSWALGDMIGRALQ